MPANPFCDPEINRQIKAKILRLQGASLEWDDNPDGRSLADHLVETLVDSLNAHAEPYLRKVTSDAVISQYREYVRGVGSVLISNAELRGVLSDPYSEHRLRELAENSGNRIRRLAPDQQETEIRKEVERLRAELAPEMTESNRRRSQMRSRIESRFEAGYRRWEADAIELAHNRSSARRFAGKEGRVSFSSGTSPGPMSTLDREKNSGRNRNARRLMVDDFLQSCREETRLRIARTHIWRAVGHNSARQFQYWQGGQDRQPGSTSTRGATAEDKRNFLRILKMRPSDFLKLLRKKGLVGDTSPA